MNYKKSVYQSVELFYKNFCNYIPIENLLVRKRVIKALKVEDRQTFEAKALRMTTPPLVNYDHVRDIITSLRISRNFLQP